MDMSGSMSSMGTSLFQVENMGLARVYWYLIIGVLGLFFLARAANFVQGIIRSDCRPLVASLFLLGIHIIDTLQVTAVLESLCPIPHETDRPDITSMGDSNCHWP